MNAAVIMAGGSGTRLWPLSRRSRPKQLLRLINGRSLLEESFDRLASFIPVEHLYVIALEEHLPAIAQSLPRLRPENLIGEPTGRDTANAVGLAAALLHRRNPGTIMGVFTADHLIRPQAAFESAIRLGYESAAAHPNALITFGVKPREPHTGMGYVQRGESVGPGLWKVRAFREKPDRATAEGYLASGEYLWNSGMFVWSTQTILHQLQTRLPESHKAFVRLADAWHTTAGPPLAAQIYPSLPKISIDYAVMEKAELVLMVEMNLEWLDVGHWTSLPAVLGADSEGNTKALQQVVTLGARSNILVSESDHLIAAIGVEDLVIIHSPDATLVCRRDQLDQVKRMVQNLDAMGLDKYT